MSASGKNPDKLRLCFIEAARTQRRLERDRGPDADWPNQTVGHTLCSRRAQVAQQTHALLGAVEADEWRVESCPEDMNAQRCKVGSKVCHAQHTCAIA